MFVIVAIIAVIGAVAGGYLMERREFAVLIQPAELVIIGRAASATILIANPAHILDKTVGCILACISGRVIPRTST